MTISNELRHAFNHWRSMTRNAQKHARPCPNDARDALRQARRDMAAGVKRYAASPWRKPYKAAFAQTEKGMFFVEHPDAAGLREVGRVRAECGGRNGIWDSRGDSGWYDNPHGESFKDGTGLIYGVVFQLPGRNGLARFIAGYQSGSDCSDGATVDLGTIYESESDRGDYYNINPCDHDAAQDAARAADSMASHAAESEREYRQAYDNGRECIEAMREAKSAGMAWLKEYRELRAVFCERWQAVNDDVPISLTRDWLRGAIAACRDIRDEYRDLRQAALDKIDDLLPGKYDQANRDAFRAGYYDN